MKFFNKLFRINKDLSQEIEEIFEDFDNVIHDDQKQMINSIIKLKDMHTDSIKITMSNMIALPINASLKATLSTIKKSGHSRIPVYSEEKGNKKYLGILHAKDLLPAILFREGRFKLSDHIRKTVFVVPESQKLLSLLRTMRIKKQHLALTSNEYGDISGLITLEDILEEIVGDIRDEFDSGSKDIKEVGLHIYKVKGETPTLDINKQLAISLPQDKFNTIGGFILHELKGQLKNNAVVKFGSLSITLEKFSGQQIKTVLIEILQGENSDENES